MLKKKSNFFEKVVFPNVPSISYLKKNIYDGKIFLFSNFKNIQEIKKIFDVYFFYLFKSNLKNALNYKKIKKSDNEILELQNLIKKCEYLKFNFRSFFMKLGFKTEETYTDVNSLRYSPKKNGKELGSLKPAKPHRDTWASNIFHQINWWMPMHDVSKENSIFIAPNYYKKSIKNNSSTWEYKAYKSKKNYLSLPISKVIIKNNEKESFKIKCGEILCFSGNHLHGSNLGKSHRLNIETRTVSKNDDLIYDVPKNIDSNNKVIQNKWFKNIKSNCFLT